MLFAPPTGYPGPMANVINTTTGAPTSKWGFTGTDLGYLVPTRHGYSLALFGDTFNGPHPNDSQGGWRSPVILRTSRRDLGQGLHWDNAVGGTRAKQVLDYRHIGDKGTVNGTSFDCFTIIPNDAIHLPDGNYLANGFRVKKWGSDATQHMCWTLSNAWFWSADKHAETWDPCRHETNLGQLYEWKNTGRDALFQNTTMVMMDPDGKTDPYVYVFGTPEGRKVDGGIYLRRAHWQHLCNDTAWEFWRWDGKAWGWSKQGNPTAILRPTVKGTPIGEVNAQVIDGVVVLAYVDGPLGAVTRTSVAPDNVWTDPQVHATMLTAPNLYAPSVHPFSSLDAPYMHMSQWYSNDTLGTFYGSKFWSMSALTDPRPAADESQDPEAGGDLHRDLSSLTAGELAEELTKTTDVPASELAAALASKANTM